MRRSLRLSGRKPLKAFLDANTIISGLLFEGNEATLLELGRVGAVRLLTNNYVLAEARSVLRRPEFSLTEEESEGLTRYLHICVTVTDDPPEEEILSNISLLRDRKDIPVVLGARSSCSDYLVTGNKELLDAADIPSIRTSDLLQLIVSNKSSKASGNHASREE